MKFINAVTTKTACQLPVCDLMTFAIGAKKPDKPFAV